jgi:hypothetical protein
VGGGLGDAALLEEQDLHIATHKLTESENDFQ